MIKYGIKEFIRNIYSNIFVSIQLAVTMIIAIATVSSVLSRTELYNPIKEIFNDGTGYFIHAIDHVTFNGVLSEINEVEKSYSSFDSNMFYSIYREKDLTKGRDESTKDVAALPDYFYNAYKPDMKSGVWLNEYTPNDKNELYAVVTENQFYKTGDVINAAYKYRTGNMSPDDEGYDEYDPYTYDYKQYKIKIVGVVKNESKMLGFSNDFFNINNGEVNNEPDFRELYTTVNKYEDFVIIMPENLLRSTGANVYPAFNRIIKLKDGVSSERVVEIARYLRQYDAVVTDLDDFRANTAAYINGQLIKLVPYLICTMILVIVSSVSISALNAKKRIKYYGILYICGTRWKSCLFINLINNILTAVMSGVLTAAFINVLKFTGLIKNTVITIGLWQIAACVLIILINLICSIIMPIGIMHRNTPKEILTSNE